MAVVFPAPAGAIASCSRAPRCTSGGPVRPAQHRVRCRSPPSPAGPDPPPSARRTHRRDVRRRRPGAAPRQGFRRGVQVGTGAGIDRRAVDPPQHLRFLDVVSRRGKGNNRRSSTSSISRSTSAGACSAATSMVRTCRCASARTCHICQATAHKVDTDFTGENVKS